MLPKQKIILKMLISRNVSESKTILITGSTDGIGKELALSLANKNYQLILHGRNEDKGLKVLREIRKINPGNLCMSKYRKIC